MLILIRIKKGEYANQTAFECFARVIQNHFIFLKIFLFLLILSCHEKYALKTN